MKKVAYFLTLTLMLTLVSVSCEKEDNDPTTLENQYPEWANLTWVSTDGVTAAINPNIYPRLNITLIDDGGIINQPYNSTGGSYVDTFTELTIDGNNVTFGYPANVTGTFTKTGTQITLTTYGLMNKANPANNHTYVLQIN